MAEKKAAAKKAPAKKAAPKKEAPAKVGRPKEFGKVTDRDLLPQEQSVLLAAGKRSGKTIDEAVVALVRQGLSSRMGTVALSRVIARWSK